MPAALPMLSQLIIMFSQDLLSGDLLSGGRLSGTTTLLAVVPIVPAVQTLLVLLPVVLTSILYGLLAIWKPKTAWQIARLLWHNRVSLLIVAVVAAISWFGWQQMSRSPVTPFLRTRPASQSPPSEEFTGWLTARGSLLRRGCPPAATGPTRGGLNWTFGREGDAFYSSAAVGGDRLYIVGSRGDRGQIYCLDADSGQVMWSCRPPQYRATFSSPVVSRDFLVCGEGLHDDRRARVVCVDLRPGRMGRVAWTFATRSHVECTPAIVGRRVYVAAGDDGVYCLRIDPGLTDEQRVVWHATGDQYPDAETALAVVEDKVYVGLGKGGNALCVLDARSGRGLQRADFDYPVFSPPAVARGRLLVGMGTGNYIQDPDRPAGQLVCLDLDTLRLQWSFATEGTILGAPVIDRDRIFCGSADGRLYKISWRGQLLGQCNCGGPLVTSPAVADGVIYLVNRKGVFQAIDPERMRPVWQHRFRPKGNFVSSPVVARGRVYLGTGDEGFVSLGSGGPPRRTGDWPGPLGGPGYAGARRATSFGTRAEVAWTFPADEDARRKTKIVAPVAVGQSSVLVPVAAGPYQGIVCLELDRHRSGTQRWSVRMQAPVRSSPIISQRRAFALQSGSKSQSRSLHCVDLPTGRQLWSRDLAPAASDYLAACPHGVILQEGDNQLALFDLRGKVVWRTDIAGTLGALNPTRARLLVTTTEPPALHLLDGPSGQPLWSKTLARQVAAMPVVDGQLVYLPTENGLDVRSLATAQLTRTLTTAPAASELSMDGGNLIYVTSAGELVCSSLAPPYAVTPLADSVALANPLVSRSKILHLKGKDLMLTDLNQREGGTAPWLSTARWGGVASSLVAVDNYVLFAVQQGGLVCARGAD